MGLDQIKKDSMSAFAPGQIDVDAFDLHGILAGLENGDFTSLELVNVSPLGRIQLLNTGSSLQILIFVGRLTYPG